MDFEKLRREGLEQQKQQAESAARERDRHFQAAALKEEKERADLIARIRDNSPEILELAEYLSGILGKEMRLNIFKDEMCKPCGEGYIVGKLFKTQMEGSERTWGEEISLFRGYDGKYYCGFVAIRLTYQYSMPEKDISFRLRGFDAAEEMVKYCLAKLDGYILKNQKIE